MKTILVVLTIAVVGTGGALLVRQTAWAQSDTEFPEDVLFCATRGQLTVTITENGSLMAKNSEKITFQGKRGGKITFLIEEGKTVDPNEVLCRLETTELEEQLQELELSILQTETDLDNARTELEIQVSENAASIEKAQFASEKAQKELEKYKDGDAPKERDNLEIAIKEARTNFSRAKKKYEDSKKLQEQDYISGSEVEQDQIACERAEIKHTAAVRDLDLFERYTSPMMLREKNVAVKDTDRELVNAEKRAKSKLRNREVAVEKAESRLKALNKQLDELKEEIASCTIKAPSPGIVLYGDPKRWWTRREVKLGGQIWSGFTIFTIPDLRVMQVRIRIHEADINKIKVDQTVTVTMDTYPGLVLTGKVTKVAQVAEDSQPWREDEVKRFTVDITLDSTGDVTLKPGISAKAEVFIETLDDVLYVPLQCVFIEEGTHYCYELRGDQPERVVVEAGATNDHYVQIVSGLESGARVLLYNPHVTAAEEAAAREGAEANTPPLPPPAAQP